MMMEGNEYKYGIASSGVIYILSFMNISLFRQTDTLMLCTVIHLFHIE